MSIVNSTLFGRKVYVIPDRPKMILSPELPVTEEFRADFNAWLLSFFGTECFISDDEIIFAGDDTVYVNVRTFNRLKFMAKKFPPTNLER